MDFISSYIDIIENPNNSIKDNIVVPISPSIDEKLIYSIAVPFTNNTTGIKDNTA